MQKRIRIKRIKKWTVAEEEAFLRFLLNNRESERSYYQRFCQEEQLNIPWNTVVKKVYNTRSSYKKTKSMNAGLLDGDKISSTFRKTCRYFQKLDKIFGHLDVRTTTDASIQRNDSGYLGQVMSTQQSYFLSQSTNTILTTATTMQRNEPTSIGEGLSTQQSYLQQQPIITIPTIANPTQRNDQNFFVQGLTTEKSLLQQATIPTMANPTQRTDPNFFGQMFSTQQSFLLQQPIMPNHNPTVNRLTD